MPDSKTSKRQQSLLNRYAPVRPASVQSSVSDFLKTASVVLSSASGADQVFKLVQYGSPLLALALTKSTTYRPLSTNKLRAQIVASLALLSSKISDARMLFRFVGLIPILRWLVGLYSQKGEVDASSKRLRAIEKAQAWSMIAYYPLEHAYYLASHGMIKMSPSKSFQCILWACRAWAVYVFLQLVHYSEDARILSTRMANLYEDRKNLKHSSISEAEPKEKDQEKVDTDSIVKDAGNAVHEASLVMNEQECMKQSKALLNGVMTNLAYVPLSVHWSLEQGLFTSPIWTSVFMSIAAITGLRGSWRTARNV